jgi:hypothetical protein
VSLNSHLLPLNVDDVFFASIANANTPVLTNTFGFLSPLGRATASFNLPPALLPSGVMGHFACAIVDLGVPAVVGTSNAVPLTLTP